MPNLRTYLREFGAAVFSGIEEVTYAPINVDPNKRPYVQFDIADITWRGLDQSKSEYDDASGHVRIGIATWYSRGYVEVTADVEQQGTLDQAIDNLDELLRSAVRNAQGVESFDGGDYMATIQTMSITGSFPSPDDASNKGTLTLQGVITFIQEG